MVAGKSTVPVGTAARLAAMIAAAQPAAVLAWNPEFLREGFALADTLRPDRLVYGLSGRGRGASTPAGSWIGPMPGRWPKAPRWWSPTTPRPSW